jgi:DNA-binding NtrC family response regulator
VRELETFLKSACLFVDGDTLDVADVVPLLERAEGKAARRSGGHALPQTGVPLDGTLADVERVVVMARLEALGGNKRQTAESLGIDRGTLYNKLRSWGELGS